MKATVETNHVPPFLDDYSQYRCITVVTPTCDFCEAQYFNKENEDNFLISGKSSHICASCVKRLSKNISYAVISEKKEA